MYVLLTAMPHLKKPQKVEPLSKLWDRKAQKCGLRHTVYSVNGDEYTGDWLDSKKHGKGTQICKKAGAIYDGDWKYGKRDGYGTYSKLLSVTNEYSREYSGGWKNDKKHGFGTYFYSDTACYEGEWSEDQRSGWGRMYYDNGDIYEGEWLKNKHHGQGMLRLANENRYEGNWKYGKKNGHGKFFYLDKGQLYEGFWVDGVAKCGTVSDFGRAEAPTPTIYPIPKVHLLDVRSVLMETQSTYHSE
ncbi:MORN repeat-containing protein 3 isoform X1 [Salvelinus namaycush]|uniref:MORN repeat-containing protein 3 n=2 Tax=Salvelinus namaycush TaxID=8040 RepID=A0A8U0PMB8_SALNM|nr:MORN repeat-containing protein 3 isoform X1 [Salvelinus namaycush]